MYINLLKTLTGLVPLVTDLKRNYIGYIAGLLYRYIGIQHFKGNSFHPHGSNIAHLRNMTLKPVP